MGAGLSLLSGLQGQEFWHGTEVYDWIASYLPVSNLVPDQVKNYDLVVCFTLLSLTKECTEKVFFVVRGYGLKSLKNFLPIASLMTFTFFSVYSDNGVFLRNQRLSFHFCACIFVDMTTNLMLDHMTEQSYNPYRPCLVPLVLLSSSMTKFLTEAQADKFLFVSCVLIFHHVSKNIIAIIDDICNFLGIWCFNNITPATPQEETNMK